jgi:hypothetical protein
MKSLISGTSQRIDKKAENERKKAPFDRNSFEIETIGY